MTAQIQCRDTLSEQEKKEIMALWQALDEKVKTQQFVNNFRHVTRLVM